MFYGKNKLIKADAINAVLNVFISLTIDCLQFWSIKQYRCTHRKNKIVFNCLNTCLKCEIGNQGRIWSSLTVVVWEKRECIKTKENEKQLLLHSILACKVFLPIPQNLSCSHDDKTDSI